MLPDSVSVLLSIGANLGDREKSIKFAVDLLRENNLISDIKLSSFYESEPVGITEQPWFLNVALSGYTLLSPYELLFIAKSIEYLSGRKKRKHWHERELDIDIIFYGNVTFESNKLTIPHKYFKYRKFVLLPALEIDGKFTVPNSNVTFKQLLEQCDDQSLVRLYN